MIAQLLKLKAQDFEGRKVAWRDHLKWSEVDSDRSLHHARRASRARRGKIRFGLNNLTESRASALARGSGREGESRRTSSINRRRPSVDTKGHGAVNVGEIRVVEDIVDLPPQLNLTLLSEADILEKRYIVIKDRRKTKQVSLQGADSVSTGFGKACRIDRKCQSRGIGRTNQLVWITKKNRTRIYLTTCEVGDCGGSTCCSFLRSIR